MEKLINEVLHRYGFQYNESVPSDLNKFVELMLKYNESHNITAITDKNDILYKHLLDSLLPSEYLSKNDKILDVGCGAGFPSVPLSIFDRNLDIIAIDSVNKKVEFVKIVKNTLNLTNLVPIHTRIEDFAGKPEYRESFDMVLSRAVAPLNIILEYSAPMLKNGGKIIAYKGRNYEEELNLAKNAMKILNCKLIEVKEYKIPDIDADRYVLVIEKTLNIPAKYPRGQNKPRLKPL